MCSSPLSVCVHRGGVIQARLCLVRSCLWSRGTRCGLYMCVCVCERKRERERHCHVSCALSNTTHKTNTLVFHAQCTQVAEGEGQPSGRPGSAPGSDRRSLHRGGASSSSAGAPWMTTADLQVSESRPLINSACPCRRAVVCAPPVLSLSVTRQPCCPCVGVLPVSTHFHNTTSICRGDHSLIWMRSAVRAPRSRQILRREQLSAS